MSIGFETGAQYRLDQQTLMEDTNGSQVLVGYMPGAGPTAAISGGLPHARDFDTFGGHLQNTIASPANHTAFYLYPP